MSLFDALRDAGLTVRADPGWESRGDDWREGQPVGVMIHHTAPPVPYPISGLNGSDGKLKCNINTKPDGTVWLVALRACNYSSGSGSSVVLDEVRASTPPDQNAADRGLRDDTNGNPYFWNFENDHPGDGSPIPQVQLEAIVIATRVCLDYFGLNPGNVISHAEWTARKVDPYWNGSYRAIEEIRDSIGDENMLPISADSHKEEIRHVQEMLGQPATGDWDFVNVLKSLAQRAGTGDPKGKDGVHVNGRMYTHLLEEFIKRNTPDTGGLSRSQVRAIVNDSQIVAPD